MSRDELRVKVCGKTWRIRFVPARAMGRDWGRCYLPPGRCGLIEIRRSLRGFKMMDVIAHEVLHAARNELDEKAVEETAFAIARALWKRGYRLRGESA